MNFFDAENRSINPRGFVKGVTSVPREQLGDPRFQPDIPDVLLSDHT